MPWVVGWPWVSRLGRCSMCSRGCRGSSRRLIRVRCRLGMRSIWCGCSIGSVGWPRRRRRRRRVGWRSRRCGRGRVIVRRRTGWPRRPASVSVRRSSCWRRPRSVAAAPVVAEALSVVWCRLVRRGRRLGPRRRSRVRVSGWWRRRGRCRSPSSRTTPTGSWRRRRAESEAEKAVRLRKKRMLRTGVDADGMGYGHWLLEPAAHARLMALIDAQQGPDLPRRPHGRAA